MGTLGTRHKKLQMNLSPEWPTRNYVPIGDALWRPVSIGLPIPWNLETKWSIRLRFVAFAETPGIKK
jgi:hypothetical protein